jgi:hypothetical protein
MREIVSEGQVVFDRAEDDQKSTLIVVEPNAGTVHEQDTRTREAIRDSEDNERFGTTVDSECAEVVYVTPDLTQKYTFPKDRLYAPSPNAVTYGYSPVVWAKAEMLVKLFQQLPLDNLAAMNADLEGKVILAAQDICDSRDITANSWTDGAIVDEVNECPDCGSNVTLTDPVESTGDGVAFGYLMCLNDEDECGWEGREEWVHTQTVPTVDDDDGVKVGEPTEAHFGGES